MSDRVINDNEDLFQAADSLPDDLRTVAHTILSPAKTVPPVESNLDLETVIEALEESEINSGHQSFACCGLRIWIGDAANGIRAVATLASKDAGWKKRGVLAAWLHEKALELYPDSAYARRHRRLNAT